jgi:hypothetical protein
VHWNPDQDNPLIIRQSSSIWSSYHYMRIIIHRVFVLGARRSTPAGARSAAVCCDAAREIVKILSVVRRKIRGPLGFYLVRDDANPTWMLGIDAPALSSLHSPQPRPCCLVNGMVERMRRSHPANGIFKMSMFAWTPLKRLSRGTWQYSFLLSKKRLTSLFQVVFSRTLLVPSFVVLTRSLVLSLFQGYSVPVAHDCANAAISPIRRGTGRGPPQSGNPGT